MESALQNRDMRMRQMMRRLNVDLLDFAYAKLGVVSHEARQACLSCPNTARCQLWLAGASTEDPLFCINLSRFERYSAH